MLSPRSLQTLAVLLGLIVFQSGCSLIGYGVGSLIDSGNKRTVASESFAPDTIEPGKLIKLRLRGGGTVDGAYLGIEPIPDEEYAKRYARARERYLPSIQLPELGDTVTLCMIGGGELHTELLGFDLYNVLVRTPGEPGLESVSPEDVDQLLVGGDASIRGETLALLLSEGALPFRSAIAMQVPPTTGRAGGKRLLPIDEVLYIEWKPGTGRTVGTIVGLTFDLAILTAAVVCAATDCFDMSLGLTFASY
jgi:hypothetical protein